MTSSASDRFIKVKFDNKAGLAVEVTPIRGIKKTKGYTVEPHMALDLTFVEKGPMNNIPVTFLASSPSSHQKLAINGKSNTLVVSPTSSKDTVVTGVITASQCKFNLLVISFHFSLLLSSFMSIFFSLFVSVLFFPSLLFRSCLFVRLFVSLSCRVV